MTHEGKSHVISVIKDYMAGLSAGFISKSCDYPLDTIKVLMQINPGAYRGIIDCCIKTFRQFGLKGFYRGIAAPLMGSTLEDSALFGSFSIFKKMLGIKDGEKISIPRFMMAAGCTALVTSCILTPLELAKCRIQMQQSANNRKAGYTGVFDVFRKTFKSDGFFGLYRGNVAMLCREVPGNIAWLGTYEYVCRSFMLPGQTKKELKFWQIMLAGGSSGFAYWSAFFPADTIKSRMQTELGKRKSFIDVFQLIIKNEGIKGLYRGYRITIIRGTCSHSIVFLIFERAHVILNYLIPY